MAKDTTANGFSSAMKIIKRSEYSTTTTVVTYVMVLLFFSLSLFHFGSLSRRLSVPSSVPLTPPSLTRNRGPKIQLQYTPVTLRDPQSHTTRVPSKINCDRSHYHYDLCSINGPTVLDPTTSTFFDIGPTEPKHFKEKIRPYPRKWENFTMSKIKEVGLLSGPQGPTCDTVHDSPALVFSAGGYTGNFFHEFNEGFLPLFITLQSMSIVDRNVVLVISMAHDWWVSKYADLLRAFSKHTIVDLDNDNATHCFTSATLGLVSHGFMTVDPKLMPNNSTTLANFHNFLDRAYSQSHNPLPQNSTDRPKLLLISRPKGVGRVMLNEAEVQLLAQKVGFEVVVFEPNPDVPVSEAYRLMNESHVMVGVHGAAMTHLLFLRPGSVFIQVVPIGTDWVAELCYGKPAKEMGLDYIKYNITIEESSLVDKYNKYDPILKEPMGLQNKGWALLKKVYLKEQDVRLDLVRFRVYLKKAYKKANRFMHQVG